MAASISGCVVLGSPILMLTDVTLAQVHVPGQQPAPGWVQQWNKLYISHS